MSEITFPQLILRGCGIDVHKKVVVATINGEGLTQETRNFDTFTGSLIELREWLLSNKVTHVAMESTGVYWKPVYTVLEDFIPQVWIVNARHIKNVPGHKTDKMDSQWICKLLLAGLLKPSFIPPMEQRQLRDLTRLRKKFIQRISSDKNRTMRILEDCNIKLSSVVSDTYGVTAQKLIDMLCEGKQLTLDDIKSVYHNGLNASPEDLLKACTGFVKKHHVKMLRIMRKDIAQAEEMIADLSEQIKDILSKYDNVMEALKEIPGFDTKVIEDLVAEIGFNMSPFPSEKHLASWAGLAPGNNESAGKTKSARITHGNVYLKAIMTEAAWAATRTKGTFYSEKYHRLAMRRGKKRALIAIAHSQLVTVYYILSFGIPYNELGDTYVPQKKKKTRVLYLKGELAKLGFKVELTESDTTAD